MKVGPDQGTTRLVQMLPSIRRYETPQLAECDVGTCVVCGDGECDGVCPGAMYVVRQVMEGLDNVDTVSWWLEEFELIEGAAP